MYLLGGCYAGYRSNLAFYPDDDLVVAHLANIYITDLPSNLPYYIADGLLDLPKTADWINEVTPKITKETYDIFATIKNGNLPDRIEGKPRSHELIDYVGDYVHPVHGKITVTLEKDESNGGVLHMKVRTLESKLDHYHYDSFKGYVHDFTVKGNIMFTFQTGSKGNVDAIHITDMGSDSASFKKTDKIPET